MQAECLKKRKKWTRESGHHFGHFLLWTKWEAIGQTTNIFNGEGGETFAAMRNPLVNNASVQDRNMIYVLQAIFHLTCKLGTPAYTRLFSAFKQGQTVHKTATPAYTRLFSAFRQGQTVHKTAIQAYTRLFNAFRQGQIVHKTAIQEREREKAREKKSYKGGISGTFC